MFVGSLKPIWDEHLLVYKPSKTNYLLTMYSAYFIFLFWGLDEELRITLHIVGNVCFLFKSEQHISIKENLKLVEIHKCCIIT